MLGQAKKIIVRKDDTTIIEGAGKKEKIKGRIEQIKTTDRRDRLRLMIEKSSKSALQSFQAASARSA